MQTMLQHRFPGVLLLTSIPLLSTGCAGTSSASRPTGDAQDPSDAALQKQALVMSMADDYISGLAEAVYLLTRRGEADPRSRWLAQSFLRNGVGASIDIAAGPNPNVAVLDLLVLSALQAWSFEEHWIPAGIGEAGLPALARLREAETRAWGTARSLLDEEQLRTLRELVDAWIAENPDQTVVALVRFDEFADQRKISSLSLRGRASGLLREVGEASEAIDDARLLGERALWYSGRFLYLLGEQAELTTYRLADQPEGRQLVQTLDAIEQVARTASARLDTLDQDLEGQWVALFEQLDVERSATISQFFDSLAAERTLLLDDLEARQDQLRGLMTELGDTLRASGELARELTGTVDAIDRVVSRFDAEESTEREPLRLEDVRDVAAEAKLAAQELTRLLETTDELLASEAWDRRAAALVDPVSVVVERAFRRGVALVVLLIGGLGLLAIGVWSRVRRHLPPSQQQGTTD